MHTYACTYAVGWSPGNCQGMPRTPFFNLTSLGSLWTLGYERYVAPEVVRDWMGEPDTFEVGALGCDSFTSTLPGVGGGGNWPRSKAEAAERPIYAVLDLKKVDVGVPDFGPIAVVFNRSAVQSSTVFMPADTGEWSGSCNMTNIGLPCATIQNKTQCSRSRHCRWQSMAIATATATDKENDTDNDNATDNGHFDEHQHQHQHQHQCVSASSNCCISQQAPRTVGCDTCSSTPECCQDDATYNCSAWDVTAGVVGSIDHTLLAAAMLWNDTGYAPETNLADLLGRAAASNYFHSYEDGGDTTLRSTSARSRVGGGERRMAGTTAYDPSALPSLRVHNNYYIEANLLYTPSLLPGTNDVLFVIGSFPFLFGHWRGRSLRDWAMQHAVPLVWALGKSVATDNSCHPRARWCRK